MFTNPGRRQEPEVHFQVSRPQQVTKHRSIEPLTQIADGLGVRIADLIGAVLIASVAVEMNTPD